MSDFRIVTIPSRAEHEGFFGYLMTVTIPWQCIYCGQERGEPFQTLSYDGSRRLPVDGWNNPCGHIETYEAVRQWIASQKVEAGS